MKEVNLENYEKLINNENLLKELVLNNKEKFSVLLSNCNSHCNSLDYCALIISIFDKIKITEENIDNYIDKILDLEAMFFDKLIILEDCIEEILNGNYKTLTNFTDFTDFDGFVEFKDIE